MILLLLACSTAPTVAPEPVVATAAPTKPADPEPPEPPEPPAPAEPADRVFVTASSLNLRSAPDGAAIGKLRVASPLQILDRKPGWLHVRVENGKEGWVAEGFVSPERLTAAAAIEKARTAPDAERLSWWQRAAALDSSRPVLEGLAAAYEATGDTAAAAGVRSQLVWPVGLYLPSALREDTLSVEWQVTYDYTPDRDLPPATWSRYGLDAAEPWWALTATGAAVPAPPPPFPP
ncbi:MAG: SH3 domain-containing protein, partial [Myxococcales bacterium]|nr:SH3 domain-containing protein [Myxococcales bacterium]